MIRVDRSGTISKRYTGASNAALAESARQVSAAEGELELLQQRVRDGLTRLLRTAAAAVPSEPGPENDPAQQLHRAVTAQVELRHGVEDLTRDLELD